MRRPRSGLDALLGITGFAVLLAGMACALFGERSRGRFFTQMNRTHGSRPRSSRTARDRLPKLATAIVGNTRGAVASVLGRPRIATFVAGGSERPVTDYRDADVWYYPLPEHAGRMGMAIHFTDHAAASVEFFKAPFSGSSPGKPGAVG